jgi:hypothetical protein
VLDTAGGDRGKNVLLRERRPLDRAAERFEVQLALVRSSRRAEG